MDTRLSDNTLRAYMADWREFTTWWGRSEVPVPEHVVEQYLARCERAGMSFATIRRRTSALGWLEILRLVRLAPAWLEILRLVRLAPAWLEILRLVRLAPAWLEILRLVRLAPAWLEILRLVRLALRFGLRCDSATGPPGSSLACDSAIRDGSCSDGVRARKTRLQKDAVRYNACRLMSHHI